MFKIKQVYNCYNCEEVLTDVELKRFISNVVRGKYCCCDKCRMINDNYISEEVREVLLQYKKDKAEGKVETVPLESLRK